MPRFPVDLLWCSNARGGQGNGWSFPAQVERQILEDHAGKSILHLFGGRSRFGVRQDIDVITEPDVVADAWLPPFAARSFDVVVLDPPYSHLNAQMKTALFRAAGWIARERVVWFHTLWASASGGLRTERAWVVRVGDHRVVRALQYFRVETRPGPTERFNRGPALKYNRWLVQPKSLF